MRRAVSVIMIAVACWVGMPGASISVAEDKPIFWAVTGVAPDDGLHLRDVPSADSRSLARIPSNARGLKHLGCLRNQLDLDKWMRMTKADRRDAQIRWCRVEYEGKQGWVAGRYLKEDASPAR